MENKNRVNMKKTFLSFLYLAAITLFVLTACVNVTPIAVSSPSSITLMPVVNTDTPMPQPTETVTPPAPILDIGSTMTGKDAMTLLYVPAGNFTMGSNYEHCGACGNDSPSYLDNKPQHSVYLDAFWIDQTEVTNKQYAMCVSAGECTLPSSLKSPMRSSYYGDSQFDNYPVVYVEWSMAKAYCEWADRRLPTEAEWEKAARGDDGRIYPWGNNPPSDGLLNFDSPIRDTAAVGSYPDGKSVYHAYDMAGNVWEWVNDWYGSYDQSSPSSNPLGPKNPSGSIDQAGYARVLRGGSWYFEDHSSRSIFRYGVVPVDFLVRSDTRSWAIPRYKDTSIYGRPPFGFGTVGIRCAMSATP